MKCRIVKLRREGVDLPKWKLNEQMEWHGDLHVSDIQDDGVGRYIKVAQFTPVSSNPKWRETLFEPRLIWVGKERFTIAGFERIRVENNVVHYAQSWLVKIGHDEADTHDADSRR